MRYMPDNNICIYIIRQTPAAVLERLTALSFADIGISAVTLAELEYGVAKSSRPQQNRIAFNGFLAPIEIAPFDARATAHYGEIWCLLEKRGEGYRGYGFAYRCACPQSFSTACDQQSL